MPPKHKSDAASGSAAKKARHEEQHVAARTLVARVLDDGATDVGADAVGLLAAYARSLEEEVETWKPKPKSADEIEAQADKIRSVLISGIKKQMSWKPSCKTRSAKWTYDGVCQDAAVFGAVLGLDGPPTWKVKKMTPEEFQEVVGHIVSSVRYDSLYLYGNVNIHYKADEGTFKCSGSYGVPPKGGI